MKKIELEKDIHNKADLVEKKVINSKTVNITKVAEILGAPIERVTKLLNKGLISTSYVNKRGWQYLIPIEDLNLFQEKVHYDKNLFYNTVELAKILKCNIKRVTYLIEKRIVCDTLCENILWDYIVPKKAVEEYINSTSFDNKKYYTLQETESLTELTRLSMLSLIKRQVICRNAVQHKYHVYLLPKEDVDAYVIKLQYIRNECFSINELMELLKLGRKRVFTLITTNIIKGAFKSDFQSWGIYVPKINVFAYLEYLERLKSEYYSEEDIKELYNAKVARTILKFYHSKDRDNVITEQMPGSLEVKMYIRRTTVEKKIKEIYGDPYLILTFKERYALRTWKEVFEYSVSSVATSPAVTESLTLFRSYCDEDFHTKVNRSWRSISREMAALYTLLFSSEDNQDPFPLTKEVWKLESSDNDNILFKLPDRLALHYKGFLDFCSIKMGAECKYRESKWTVTSSKKERQIQIIPGKYNRMLVDFLNDIEGQDHVRKAIEDSNYASVWAFTLMHINVGWRSGDIHNLYTPDLDTVLNNRKELTLDYLRDNTLTYTEATRIRIQYHYTDMRAQKSLRDSSNGKQLVFTVSTSSMVPLMTAIAICASHQKNQGYPKLIYINNRITGTIDSQVLRRTFKGFLRDLHLDIALTPSVIKNTYLSNLFYEGLEEFDDSDSALVMTQISRGHTPWSNTMLMHYIAQLKDGPWKKITLSLCEQGFFGGTKLKLIELICKMANYEETSSYRQKQKMIDSVDSIFNSVLEIENYIAGLLSISYEEVSIANKILASQYDQIDPSEAKNLLVRLLKGEYPSKLPDAQCLAGGCNQCPFPIDFPCKGCKYLIPKDTILISIGHDLRERVKKLVRINLLHRVRKEQLWIERMLTLIQEAICEFGEEQVVAFIPDFVQTLQEYSVGMKNLDVLEMEEKYVGRLNGADQNKRYQ